MSDSDRGLVRQSLAGDHEAFDLLFRRHASRVFHFLRRLTGEESDAEELTQETFLAAHRSLASWRREGRFGTWLCGISFRQYAAARRQQRLETEPLDEKRNRVPMAPGGDPLAQCLRHEQLQRIETALTALPPLPRELFLLVKVEGLSYREAADWLSVPLGTVQSRLCYVEFRLPRVWLDQLSTGDALKLLAPLESRPTGAPLPRKLTMNLEVLPNVMTSSGSSILFRQEFAWTVSLPEQTAPVNIDDYLPPGHRQRMRFAPGSDQSTVAANIAAARAGQYQLQNDFGRAIFWHKRSLTQVEPFTNAAQLRRLDLAHLYAEARDPPRAAAMYREVIRISREHPETWNHYAYQAKGGLKLLPRYRRPRR